MFIPNNAQSDTEKFRKKLVEDVEALTQECRNLMRMAAREPDIFKKRSLIEQARTQSLQILKVLPSPGTEGTTGQPSIWFALSQTQRQEMLKTIAELEHLAWESQMKLGITNLGGKDRFLLVKAQAIRFAIIRSEVAIVQAQVKKILYDAVKNNPATVIEAQLPYMFLKLNQSCTAIEHLNLQNIFETNIEKLAGIINKQGLPPESIPSLGILALDGITLDTLAHNQLLSQDLTACLSEDGEMEGDLLALYHFMVSDQNRGRSDRLHDFMEGGPRAKFLISRRDFASVEALSNTVEENFIPTLMKKNYLSFNNDKAKNDYTFQILQQIEKGEYYYLTATDPDFTLYTQSPTMGVTFFQAAPATFLEQDSLDLKIDQEALGPKISYTKIDVIGDDKISVAQVKTLGNKDFVYDENQSKDYSEEEKQLRIHPKKPFLPTVDNVNYTSSFPDCRTLQSFDVWLSYITESTQAATLAIPPQILQKLFFIRQTPISLVNNRTAYSYDTAINALSFLADPSNLKYLKHDFVQQFLEESLFGSFVMQQALVECPDLVISSLDGIRDRLDQALVENHYEAIGFLSNVIRQVHAHAQFTQKNLHSHGLFSGLYNGSLPSMLSLKGGLFSYYLDEFSKFHMNYEKFKNKPIEKGDIDIVDPTKTVQPLLYSVKMINTCVE
ncbi:MAG TPA: hypothetical protein VIH61_04155, partial [Waddliaceae bacterium]